MRTVNAATQMQPTHSPEKWPTHRREHISPKIWHIGADFALFSDPYLNHQELPANLDESRQFLKQFAEFHSILQAAPHDLC